MIRLPRASVIDLLLGSALLILAGCASPPPQEGVKTGIARFSNGGPNAEEYRHAQGYPVAAVYRPNFFVGSFTHQHLLADVRLVRRADRPLPLHRASAEPAISYRYLGESRTVDDYLARNPVTGLLVAQNNTILVERCQYARHDGHRFTSASMAKTVTAMLVGIAVSEGAIRSLDDPAGRYVPALAHTEYGRTSVRHLLLMSSGVRFVETYGDTSDFGRLWQETVAQGGPGGTEALRHFNERTRQSGAVFSYSSAETQVLGLVLANATHRTVADHLRERI